MQYGFFIWGFPAWAGRMFCATSVALPPAKPVFIVLYWEFGWFGELVYF